MIESILQQVQRIPLPIRRVTQHTRLGRHRSRQRGSGLDFDQIKDYQHGEAVRKVNWAATARRGGDTPLVNTYLDEQDSIVMLLVDLSASMNFGSTRLTKKTLAAEVCASLTYSALMAHDRVGFLGFATNTLCYLPPRPSWSYLRAIPECILTCQAEGASATYLEMVQSLDTWLPQSCLVFVLSDFLTEDKADLRDALIKLRRRHDVVSLRMTDPLEMSLPRGRARLLTRDLETGTVVRFSLTRKNRQALEHTIHSRTQALEALFRSLRLPCLTITPMSNYVADLIQFFSVHHGKVRA
jgi:uncharacterized protein (DUF58 family)